MPPMATKRRPAATKPVPAKKKGGGAVVAVGAVAGVGGLIWWLLSRRRASAGPPTPPPADPVVNVGDDQAVTLDATSNAAITITFSVVADNPVNLVWTRTSGPAPVNFSPLGPNQERAAFQTPGTYLIRLTATDTTDGRAKGFDEMVVTVNEFLLAAILVPGELKVDGFATYTLTRNLGDTISFVWPVTNVGNLQGAAFIQLTEGGAVVGTGAPFPIEPGLTVDVNFNPIVSLPTGVHILAARVMEGLGPDGIPLGSAQIITLTVVSVAVLAAVGLPTVAGQPAPSFVTVSRLTSPPVPVAWPCQNSGGGTGQARLRAAIAPPAIGFPVNGSLVPIPGFSTLTLLLNLPTSGLIGDGRGYTVTLTMQDSSNVILGTFQFILSRA